VRLTIVCLALAVVATGCGAESGGQPPPALTRLTLSVRPLSGGPPTSEILDDVVATLRHRVSAAGIDHVTVAQLARTVVVLVPPSAVDRIKPLVTQVGVLRFRQVLAVDSYPPASVAASGAAAEPDSINPLPDSESASLSRQFEASFARWDCAKNPNPTNGNDVPSDYIIACDSSGTGTALKYLLAPAALEGTDIKEASAGLTSQGPDWVVNLAFTGRGSTEWLDLTKTAYEATGSSSSGFGSCRPPTGCNAVGITLDGVVESAPAVEIDGIPGGMTVISGDFDEAAATNLADVLTYRALPARLTVIGLARSPG
jgi:preprotein translocase subunit SecD